MGGGGLPECRMTTSGKHIPVQRGLYQVGKRLTDPSEKPQPSHEYWSCYACNMIDDKGVWEKNG